MNIRTGLAITTLLSVAGTTIANDEDRPKYAALRHTEDWSVLKNVEPSDPFDRIKYVSLSEDGNIWASFGGQARGRIESWSGFNFGASTPDDDTFALGRALVHGDIHFGQNVRVFVEGKSAIISDRELAGGRRTLDHDALDLEQAFVDVLIGSEEDDVTLTLRPGRQQFLFGRQRLVSPLGWSNTMRRWDGISAIVDMGEWNVHGFWSQFAPVQKSQFNTTDDGTEFYGVYASGYLGPSEADLYFLVLDLDAPQTYNGSTGAETRYTIGGRLGGNFGAAFGYEAEAAYQFGEVGSADVNASMVSAEIYTQAVVADAKLFAGFDYATGDSKVGGDVETFNQLFPLGHAYLGYIDAIGRQNISAVNAGVSVTPFEDATLRLAGHGFWRSATSDGLYNAGGALVRAGGTGASSEIGYEVDVTLVYRVDRHLTLEVGYAHFFAGQFIDDTGPSTDIDFAYAQATYTF